MDIKSIPNHELERLKQKAQELSGSKTDFHTEYSSLLARRLNNEPLQYIEEFMPFYTAQLRVDGNLENSMGETLSVKYSGSEDLWVIADQSGKKLKEFKPEFVLISAGFDGHIADPLAQLKLGTEDYYEITKRILKTSKKFSNGKVVSILEGGYDLQALKDSTKRHVDALLEFN